MNQYEKGMIGNNRIERGQKIGCTGCFPVALVTVAIIIGVLVWRVDSAANVQPPQVAAAATIEETEPTQEDIAKLCSLPEVICDGEAYASAAQENWIDRLELCESSGNPEAINKMDRDGTPSYGSFQFKPSTFKLYGERYGIEGALMSRTAQRAMVVEMLSDPKVRWQNEFPDCVKKLGLPPKK